MGVITDDNDVEQRQRQRLAGPCSACGDGDTAMRFHSHDDVEQRVSRALRSITQRQYTLEEIEGLAQEYCDDPASKARLDEILRLSLFIEWLRKREREGGR